MATSTPRYSLLRNGAAYLTLGGDTTHAEAVALAQRAEQVAERMGRPAVYTVEAIDADIAEHDEAQAHADDEARTDCTVCGESFVSSNGDAVCPACDAAFNPPMSQVSVSMAQRLVQAFAGIDADARAHVNFALVVWGMGGSATSRESVYRFADGSMAYVAPGCAPVEYVGGV